MTEKVDEIKKEADIHCAYSEPLCAERHDRLDTVMDRYLERIEQLEVCTVKLTQVIERYDKQLDRHEIRLENLEKTPAVRMERLVWYVISAVLGAAATLTMKYLDIL